MFFSFPPSQLLNISYGMATTVTFHICCHLLHTYPITRWWCIVFDAEGIVRQTINNFTIQRKIKKRHKHEFKYFMLGWLCILNYMYNNQLDALFILSFMTYHTSTSFGNINSPSSGGRMYICGKWYWLCFWVDCQRAWMEWNWCTGGGCHYNFLLCIRPTDNQFRSITHTICHIHTARSESRCALRLRYVDLVVSIEVGVEMCCCFTVFSC
jgi:hypothetical protein